nr:hypothetical protein CFP56_46431 [Quercus suber]
MHGDPMAVVAEDGDDEVDVDIVAAAHTGPPPSSLRAMMETIMRTQATYGQVLYGLLLRRERDSDEREYYAGLRQEWDFRVNESNALHDDLVRLEAPLVDQEQAAATNRQRTPAERNSVLNYEDYLSE